MTTKYTFSSIAHGTCSRIDRVLSHKINSTDLARMKLYKICSPTTIESNQKSVTEGNLRNSQKYEN